LVCPRHIRATEVQQYSFVFFRVSRPHTVKMNNRVSRSTRVYFKEDGLTLRQFRRAMPFGRAKVSPNLGPEVSPSPSVPVTEVSVTETRIPRHKHASPTMARTQPSSCLCSQHHALSQCEYSYKSTRVLSLISVTGVGGTVNVPETAVSFSGGGFSDYFSRPKYQNKAIEDFFNIFPKGTYDGLFNRCVPISSDL
jgi:hypothetical protein